MLSALADLAANQDEDDDAEEEEEQCFDKHDFKCEKFLNDKTNGGADVSEKLCFLYVMSIGQKNNALEGLALDAPPFSKLPKEYRVKIAARHFNDEIIRRGEAYVLIEKKRPNQWKNEKRLQWLQQNPIPKESIDDLKYIQDEWFRMKSFCDELLARNGGHNKDSVDATTLKKKWDGNITWLCLFLCFTVDPIKESFLLRHQPMNREEIDALNTSMARSDYRQLVVDYFNDPDWRPHTESIPDLHDDFEVSIFCPLTVSPIDITDVKDRMSAARVLLQTIVTKWERSGSGRLMFFPEEDDNFKSEDDIYRFEDGDDRKNFLAHAKNRSYILYWWHIAYTHQLLTSAHESLCSDVSADSSQVPSTCSVNSRASSQHEMKMTEFQNKQLGALHSLSSGIKHLTQGMELAERIKSLEERRSSLESKIEKLQEQFDLLTLQALASNNNPSYTLQLDHQKVRKEAEMQKLEEDLSKGKEDIEYHQLR